MRKSVICLLLVSVSVSAQKTAQKYLHFAVAPGIFVSSGRWVPSNPKDKAAFPSEVEIDCDAQTRMCIEATAEYFAGHPHVSIDYFDIMKWDANGIVASSSSAICMTRTILVSFADKSISDTHSEKVLDKDKKGACASIRASGTETDVFVVKGSDKWEADPYGAGK
ncbi:MAG: hypothetical protein C5B58_07340 [Acidobacteria bacterium]|nr:MAG: hypothetical protein C5B58_07340 [Acidobacteriota bacterium]